MADQYMDYVYDLGTAATSALAQAVGQAIAQASQVQSRQLKALSEVFLRRLGNGNDMREAHQKVGELAQNSVVRSYDQLVTAREGWASRQHYRRGASDNKLRRFSGGVLRRALNDGDFFEATPEGLFFVNITMLDRKAMQWHRLAFGAGGRGSGSTERYPVTWGNVVVATLGFDEPASAAFVLPRGVWVGPEGPVKSGAFAPGSDMFYPLGEARAAGISTRRATRRPRMTAGIERRDFLGAGLRRIGRELPVAYGQLYREWWGQAQQGVGPLTQVTSTSISRPVTIRSRVPRRGI